MTKKRIAAYVTAVTVTVIVVVASERHKSLGSAKSPLEAWIIAKFRARSLEAELDEILSDTESR